MKVIRKFIGTISYLLLKVSEIFSSALRTASGRSNAILSDDCLVLDQGRIVNIFGDPAHIRVGAHARIKGELLTFAHAGRIEIGEWFYLGPKSMIWSSDLNGIKIGDRVLISANVMIHDTNSHPMDAAQRFEQTKAIFQKGHPVDIDGIRAAPISIGDDVWIGAGAIILKGVSIGDRTIIGAGSLIADNIQSDMLIPAGSTIRKKV